MPLSASGFREAHHGHIHFQVTRNDSNPRVDWWHATGGLAQRLTLWEGNGDERHCCFQRLGVCTMQRNGYVLGNDHYEDNVVKLAKVA
eukprot:3258020-Amphidinium_carterae.1